MMKIIINAGIDGVTWWDWPANADCLWTTSAISISGFFRRLRA